MGLSLVTNADVSSDKMITPEIREKYPAITEHELQQLTNEEFNKLSIKLHEDCIRDYKAMLDDLFKDKDTVYPDWYKNLLRDLKTTHEKEMKSVVFAQNYIREGLNHPGCYPRTENNPYGSVKTK